MKTIVSWLFSMASSANKKANLAKAAKLKIYDCRLSWTDPKVITSRGKPASVAIGTTVIADSEHRARQMSQERANKEDPVITSAFSSKKVVPPYITDPVGTLAKWQVGPAVDLGDDARDSAAKGMLDAAVVSYAMTPQIV